MNMQQIKSRSRKQSPKPDSGAKRPPGRPRSKQAHSAILNSTLRLLQRTGFSELSIEAIAADASVGKATVYRWWPSKGALVADAFGSSAARELRYPDTGSVREDMRQQMKHWVKILRGRRGRVVAAIVGGGQSDKELIEAFRERFVWPRRLDAYEILRRGMRRGELPRNADMDLVLDLLYGAIYIRFLIWHEGLSDEFVDEVVELVFSGAGTQKPVASRNGNRRIRPGALSGQGSFPMVTEALSRR